MKIKIMVCALVGLCAALMLVSTLSAQNAKEGQRKDLGYAIKKGKNFSSSTAQRVTARMRRATARPHLR